MIDYDGWDAYRVVLVTGPQRSGTTFVARVIAHDTGRLYVDEDAFDIHGMAAWRRLVESSSDAVIQCPSMMHLVRTVPSDCLVVVVRRPLDAIGASERRICWDGERLEVGRFSGVEVDVTAGESRAAAVKYAWWADHRSDVPHWVEVDYESLSDHPLWVEDREGFEKRQWEVSA